MVKIEMHCHSAPASRCAKVDCATAAKMLRDNGYDGVVLTNHYTYYDNTPQSHVPVFERIMHDYELMCEEGAKNDLKVFFGAELRFFHRPEDFLLYGVTPKELNDLGAYYQMDQKSFYAIKPAHALLVQAHPYRPMLRPADPAYLDGVEIHNGVLRHMNNNDKALAFAKQHGLLMTAGSDLHQIYDGGLGGMLFETMPSDEHELAQMIRDGRATCYGGKRCKDPYNP